MEQQIVSIPIEQIARSPFNRTIVNDESLRELRDSIIKQGVLQPLIVRAMPKPNGQRFELVAGERRWVASQHAKLAAVPCRVIEATDTQVLEIQTVENLQRKDVTAIEEARGYAKLCSLGKNPKDIAGEIGKSLAYVYGRISLLKCSKPVLESLEKAEITPSHAVLLASLPTDQQEDLLEECRDYHRSVADLERDIKSNRAQLLTRAPWKLNDAWMKETAPACTMCPRNTSLNDRLRETLKAKPGMCTDTTCFAKKLAAHIERIKTFPENKGATLLSGQYGGPGISKMDWEPAKKKDKKAKRGIVISGDQAGHVVMFLDKRKPAPKGRKGPSFEDQQKARNVKAKRERTWRAGVYAEVMKKVPKALGPRELNIILKNMSSRGTTVKTGTVPQRLIALALHDDITVRTWWIKKPANLLELAKCYKVDVKKIQKEALAKDKK